MATTAACVLPGDFAAQIALGCAMPSHFIAARNLQPPNARCENALPVALRN
jgi:hypothetical protein